MNEKYDRKILVFLVTENRDVLGNLSHLIAEINLHVAVK